MPVWRIGLAFRKRFGKALQIDIAGINDDIHTGDYLINAQSEDVVAGIRNTLSLADLERLDKTSYE